MLPANNMHRKECDTLSDWKKTYYVKKGLSHIAEGTKCQDSVKVAENDEVLVAALADGLGSLVYSELASQTAAQAVCDYFMSFQAAYIDADTGQISLGDRIISCVKDAILVKAAESGIPSSGLDCTLAFVCINKTNNHAVVGLIGDSAVCIFGKEKNIAVNDGNKSANGTHAVLDEDASRHLLIEHIDLDQKGVLGFILTSDGLENGLSSGSS